MVEMFNNREIASIIWLLIFFTWAFSQKNIRSSFHDLLKAFFHPKIFSPMGLMFLYILFVVLVFKKIGFWDKSALKDTVLWTIGVAIIMYLNSDKANKDDNYFKKTITDNIKSVLILEFLINMYTFSLVAEIILLPVITLLFLMKFVSGNKPEFKITESFSTNILMLFGVGLILFTTYETIIDFQNLAALSTIRDFLLPPVLTVALLPFIYLMALYIQYENIFVRIDFLNNSSEMAGYAKRRIFTAFHFNLRKLNRWSRKVGMLKVSNREDVEALLREYDS